VRDQPGHELGLAGIVEIRPRAPLPAAGVEVEHLDAREPRRVETEHLGAMRGEGAPRRRSGKDAGEVEDPHAREGSVGRARLDRRRVADPGEAYRVERAHQAALGVRGPLIGGADDRAAQAGGRECVLELLRAPRGDGRRQRARLRRGTQLRAGGIREVVEPAVEMDQALVGRRTSR
jgi:hypothetical protein